jgi:DNA processing protein
VEPTYVEWARVREACPGRAAGIPGAARGLYVCGSLEGLGRPAVAIVGTRASSGAGQALTRKVAARVAQAGVCIISGLALGIDAAAHEGALDAGGPTIGILGGGHRHFFPPRNRGLAERILAAGGAVCSPYEPELPAQPWRFLERNAVVAALADAVVVVEAPQRSGALNTAAWAAGRIPVLVFPGDVDRRSVAGCLALIRDGATLVRDAADILRELRLEAPQARALESAQPRLPCSPLHQQLLDALAIEALSSDDLVERIAVAAPVVLAGLTELELAGIVERRDGVFAARR